jgi:hypothetical protein
MAVSRFLENFEVEIEPAPPPDSDTRVRYSTN